MERQRKKHGVPRRSSRSLQWTLGLSALLCLDCRTLTAEPAPAPAASPTAAEVAETIYDSGLVNGWQDYGWGKHQLAPPPARIDFSNFGGWILHHDGTNTRYGALVFRMLAPGSFGNFLTIQLANGDALSTLPSIDIGPERQRLMPDGWTQVSVSFNDLNPSGAAFDRISMHASAKVTTDWVRFDKIVLTRAGGSAVTATAAAVGSPSGRRSTLSVDCRAPGHPISQYIYGVAGDYADLGATAHRWGGNPTSRYNWQIGAQNTAKDWYFENQKALDHTAFIADDVAHHLLTALTVPTIGWVAKDKTSFGFPISVYGAQHAKDPYRADAGDGLRPDGTEIPPKSPTQTSVAAGPDMIRAWVDSLRAQDQKTNSRGVQMYILDNEPSLWNSTHRDVHPEPLTYDELLDRTIRYGSAIRAADPQALIAGPAEWGWTGYFYSAKDVVAGVRLRPDRRAHGDEPLLPWYLKQVHDHDVATKTKVLDVLDVHFYPQENNVYGPAADPSTAALRLRSTRSLWDPTYKDESWIKEPIQLIPRLKEWVRQNYPGLQISIGEYNFGGEGHMSGSLAQAEALGRFGAGGVDYAFYWTAPPKNSPAYWAFRAYRNFDGKGGQFLGRSVDTKMDDGVSIFASRDESGKHLVLVVLNLDPSSAVDANVELNGCGEIATRRKFSYTAGSSGLADGGTKSGGKLQEALPPYSINVFDVVLK